jgi:hypothetical protein
MRWNDTLSCHLQQSAAIYRQEFRRFAMRFWFFCSLLHLWPIADLTSRAVLTGPGKECEK